MRPRLRWSLGAVGLVLWSWLWLLPVGGFHHMFRCGLLNWAILDGENEGIELRWSGVLLALSVLGWLLGVVAVRALARRTASR